MPEDESRRAKRKKNIAKQYTGCPKKIVPPPPPKKNIYQHGRKIIFFGKKGHLTLASIVLNIARHYGLSSSTPTISCLKSPSFRCIDPNFRQVHISAYNSFLPLFIRWCSCITSDEDQKTLDKSATSAFCRFILRVTGANASTAPLSGLISSYSNDKKNRR